MGLTARPTRQTQAGLLILLVLLGAAWYRHSVRPEAALPPPPRPAEPSLASPPSPSPSPPARPASGTAIPVAPPPPRTEPVEIRGSLFSLSGAPIGFAEVQGFAVDALRRLTRLKTQTDGQGAFRVLCPAWTRCTLTAHLPGQGRVCCPVLVHDGSEPDKTITMTSRVAVEFDGMAVRPDGTPLSGARLRFHPVSAPYVDSARGPGHLNLIEGFEVPDPEWDERCRKELYLTDCEVTADARGQFHADSLVTSTEYRVEALLEEGGRAQADLYTRGLNGRVRLQFPP